MTSDSTPAQASDQAARPLASSKKDTDRILLFVIRLGACLCFAGWTWVHFYWEGPYGVLLWQDFTFELASRYGIDWDEFVGSGADDGFVQKWLARVAWLYLLCTVLTLTAGKRSWIQMMALLGGSGLLVVLSYAKYVAVQRQPPMFVEHGGQILIPVLLVLALAQGVRHRLTVATAIVAFVMIFVGHGSYALDFWPAPATFHAMTCVILHVEYETAQILLRIFGVLDFLVCVGIFIPLLRRTCALYAAAWGFLTAIARPVASMSWGLNYWGADQYLHEVVLRAPHILIPLYLFFLWHKPKQHSLTSLDSPDKEIS